MNRIGKERGWPPTNRAHFEQQAGPHGALCVGSPDTVARHIQTMRDMGVGHVLCWMNFGGLPQDKIRRSMELFAREVMPRFRAPAH